VRTPLRAALRETLLFAAVLTLCHLFIGWCDARPGAGSPLLRPLPDASENAFVALAFAEGRSPLLPIANELHPSRFSPVHPFIASLWIRANGGGLRPIYDYPVYAVCLGALFLSVWLGVAGVSSPLRLIAVIAVLHSPLMIGLAQFFLQEPTFFLLFTVGGVAWSAGIRGAGRNPNGIAALGALAFAGALWAALACARPPLMILGCLALAAIPLSLGKAKCLNALVAVIIGGMSVVVLCIVYQLHVAGLFHVVAYHHWAPDFVGFHWAQPLRPPLNVADTPLWLLLLRDTLGLTEAVTVGWWITPALALVGVLLLALRRLSTPARGLGVLLLLFWVSQMALHAFYEHHDARFAVLSYPSLLMAGLIGWDGALRALWSRSAGAKLLAVTVALTLGIGLTGAWSTLPLPEDAEESQDPEMEGESNEAVEVQPEGVASSEFSLTPVSASLESATGESVSDEEIGFWDAREFDLRLLAGIRAHIDTTKRLECPVFVDRTSLLNTRIFLEMADSPQVFASLTEHLDHSQDGHLPQFWMSDVGPPRGLLESAEIWPNDPLNSCLLHNDCTVIDDGRIERLIAQHGRIAIMYTIWRRKDLEPLFTWADAHGLQMRDAARDTSWRLRVLEPKP
jgi:hypothetical protein